MPNEPPMCCLCGERCEPWHDDPPPHGYGHNPEPLAPWPHRCCDSCNTTMVIPARLGRLNEYLAPADAGADDPTNTNTDKDN